MSRRQNHRSGRGPYSRDQDFRPSQRRRHAPGSSNDSHDASEGPSSPPIPETFPQAAPYAKAPAPIPPPPTPTPAPNASKKSKKKASRPRTPKEDNDNARGKKTPKRDDLHDKLVPLAGPAFEDYTRCDDAIDPISQLRIWDNDKRGKNRRVKDTEITYLFSYVEVAPTSGKEYIRGFDIESMQQLLLQSRKTGKPITHPMSSVPIPDKALDRAKEMIKVLIKEGKIEGVNDEDPTSWTLEEVWGDPYPLERLRKMSFAVFQPFFTRASMEIPDDCLFLPLKYLKMVSKEMGRMIDKNMDLADQWELLGHTSEEVFCNPPRREHDMVPWIYFILHNIHLCISSPTAPDHLIKMAMYILVAALGVVSPVVRDRYSNSFSLDFDEPDEPNDQEEADMSDNQRW